ncbi:PLDc N-terminal domain-containing protein [Methanothermococcus okinawensis]|uniref:Cardiolipin synthase N-terminal domain-containing protein n=1 Tax=Methanothermococcus okinawensis (strain DSM 14208 / JCM 11175 / IH1) TaxID=647113 RepID=F8ANA9_METOI|nr:PLDc N-terminal domain-containing protein [Methanothermococcus okinawensis]AEH06168.1 hypothetical protein Metok_0175 [Methanothermococcus okinawensis IH1]
MWISPMNMMMGNYWNFGFMFFGFWTVIKIIVFILVVVDIVKRDDLDILEKILWLLIVWFLGIIGAIIYYLLSKRR